MLFKSINWIKINPSQGDCSDRLKNGDEEGIDCGGSCPEKCGKCPISIKITSAKNIGHRYRQSYRFITFTYLGFTCDDGQVQIKVSWKCNGENNCDDNTDEDVFSCGNFWKPFLELAIYNYF